MATDYKSMVRRFYEEVENRQKLDVADELIHPEFRDVHNSASPFPVEGIEGVKKLATGLHHALDLQIEILELIAEGDRVTAHINCHVKHQSEFMGKAPTDEQFEMQGVEIFRGKDGKLAERWVFIDQIPMMRALGVLPNPGTH
jgi:predicted ester cyclase